MTKKSDPMNEMPEQLRDFAEKSVGEARKAMDEFIKNATTAVGDMEERSGKLREGASEMNRQAKAFAEDNIKAAFNLAEQMVAARDAESLMKIQQDYFAERMASMAEQTKAIGDAASKTASDAMKPKD